MILKTTWSVSERDVGKSTKTIGLIPNKLGSRKAPFFYAHRNQFPDPHRASCRTELPRPVPRSAPSLKPSAASRQKFVRPYKKPKPVPRFAPSLTLRISSFLYVRTNLECTHVSHWFIYNVYFFGLLSTYCIFFFKLKCNQSTYGNRSTKSFNFIILLFAIY